MNLHKPLSSLAALLLCLGGCSLRAVEEIAQDDTEAPAAETPLEAVVADTTDALLEVKFIESAPTDRFVITNRGACELAALTLELDLTSTVGGLIFDTTATGAGVDVFQPFEVREGNITPLAGEAVEDGATQLALRIVDLGPGDRASFTIDVDDTLLSSELGQSRVATAEISGAIAHFTLGEAAPISAEFGEGGAAQATLPDCLPVQGAEEGNPVEG